MDSWRLFRGSPHLRPPLQPPPHGATWRCHLVCGLLQGHLAGFHSLMLGPSAQGGDTWRHEKGQVALFSLSEDRWHDDVSTRAWMTW